MGKKEVRAKFREDVFQRDSFTCKVCGQKGKESELDAHHITDREEMPNGGYVASNGITVCKSVCHLLVEKFHLTGGQSWMPNLHPDDLYKKIKSSFDRAVKDSLKLK